MCVRHLKINHILVNIRERYFLYSEPTHHSSSSPKFCPHLKANKQKQKQTNEKQIESKLCYQQLPIFSHLGVRTLANLPPTKLEFYLTWDCTWGQNKQTKKQWQNLKCTLRGVLIYKYNNRPWISSILCLYSRIIIVSSFWRSMIYLIMGLGQQ